MGATAVGRLARVICLVATVGLAQSSVQAAGASSLTSLPAKSSRAQLRHGGRASKRVHSPRAHAAIVGGNRIAVTQAPWQVALEVKIPVGKQVLQLLCGGSILDATHVLTAAHCVFDPTTEAVGATGDITVRAGASKLPPLEEQGEQVLGVSGIRVHPYFNPEGEPGPGRPDDVAILQLASPLTPTSSIRAIALAPLGSTPSEGTPVNLTGFGEQNPDDEELNGGLYSLAMAVDYSRMCGGVANAVFVCASAPAGSACFGDSGGGLTGTGPNPTLIGVVDTVEQGGEEESCVLGGINGFANVAAPEIRDFIEGSQQPPQAPRGGGAVIRGVIVAGHSLTCEPGVWGNAPTFTYAFIDGTNGEVLQSGASDFYPLSSTDVGLAILCEVHAANGGGTGVGRTPALPPIQAAAIITTQHEAAAPGPGSPPVATPLPSAAPEPSRTSLMGATITVQSSGAALVRLNCIGQAVCHGKLTLTTKRTVRRNGKTTSRTVPIGTLGFSIPGERATTVRINLGPAGRGLLGAARGHLAARLAILGIGTLPMPAEVKAVNLVLEKRRGKH